IITVSGNHTYDFTAAGIYHANVKLQDDTGNSVTANDTIFVAPDVSGQMNHLGTAPIFNPATGLYYGDLTVTNVSTGNIAGPLYVMLQNLPAGVTLTSFPNADSHGDPWVKINQSVLNAGASLPDLPLSFADPSGVPISYTVKVYDGLTADP